MEPRKGQFRADAESQFVSFEFIAHSNSKCFIFGQFVCVCVCVCSARRRQLHFPHLICMNRIAIFLDLFASSERETDYLFFEYTVRAHKTNDFLVLLPRHVFEPNECTNTRSSHRTHTHTHKCSVAHVCSTSNEFINCRMKVQQLFSVCHVLLLLPADTIFLYFV